MNSYKLTVKTQTLGELSDQMVDLSDPSIFLCRSPQVTGASEFLAANIIRHFSLILIKSPRGTMHGVNPYLFHWTSPLDRKMSGDTYLGAHSYAY